MVYPTIYRVSNIQGGAGFLPSTVACQLIGCPFMAERPMHPRTCGFACGSIPARILSAFRLEQVPILFSSEGENRRAKNWSESWIQRQQQVIECLAGIHLTYPYFSFRSSMIPQNLTISIHILPYFSMWMSGAEASNWIRTSSSLLGWTSFSSWRNAKAPRRIPLPILPVHFMRNEELPMFPSVKGGFTMSGGVSHVFDRYCKHGKLGEAFFFPIVAVKTTKNDFSLSSR